MYIVFLSNRNGLAPGMIIPLVKFSCFETLLFAIQSFFYHKAAHSGLAARSVISDYASLPAYSVLQHEIKKFRYG